jgi:tryptophan halogenase
MIQRVGVVGGGTAGYFTAIGLKRAFPDLHITVVQSAQIPVIGVGEATTNVMVPFLHRQLGIAPDELFATVRPTFKLGIRFQWGKQDFSYPFHPGDIAAALAFDGHLDQLSIGAALMARRRAPILTPGMPGEAPRSLLSRVLFGYHLENRAFVGLLASQAHRLGIAHLDATLAGVRRQPNSPDQIAALALEGGSELAFDLYVDCTGFRSVLLGDALQTPFIDYGSSLFCDRAIVAEVPHDDDTSYPYTLAESMDHGWCWGIPVADELHRGYVFSSQFATEDQAEVEMRAKNPTMGSARVVRFRSGRHHDFWRGNVAAVGNAYAFVEPLESTALHMAILEVGALISGIERIRQGGDVDRPALNAAVGGRWDYLRWFLAVHYRFNERLDTPFWRACRADANIGPLVDDVASFRAHGPLTAQGGRTSPYALFGDFGLDVLLAGQGVTSAPATTLRSRTDWDQATTFWQSLTTDALSQGDALRALAEQTELRSGFIDDPTSWVYGFEDGRFSLGDLEPAALGRRPAGF